MRLGWFGIWLTLMAAVALAATPKADDEPLGTFNFDVVELLQAKGENPGKAEIAVDRYGYRYLFTTDENRKAFLASPSTYEVQEGGGCARMGPLSGRGLTKLYAVHSSKLYIFASNGCRDTFLKSADRFTEPDEAPISGSEEDLARGKKLLAKAVEWAGGAERIASMQFYQERFLITSEIQGKSWENEEVWASRFPAGDFKSSRWNKGTWQYVATVDEAIIRSLSGEKLSKVEPLAPAQARALARERNHKVLVILKESQKPSFLATAGDSASSVAQVDTHFDGTKATLEIEKATGRVSAVEYNGRGSNLSVGRIRLEFTSYAEVEGVKMPNGWTAFFDGERAEPLDRTGLTMRLNASGTPFEKPVK